MGARSPANRFSIVDLPQPDAPTIVTNSRLSNGEIDVLERGDPSVALPELAADAVKGDDERGVVVERSLVPGPVAEVVESVAMALAISTTTLGGSWPDAASSGLSRSPEVRLPNVATEQRGQRGVVRSQLVHGRSVSRDSTASRNRP